MSSAEGEKKATVLLTRKNFWPHIVRVAKQMSYLLTLVVIDATLNAVALGALTGLVGTRIGPDAPGLDALGLCHLGQSQLPAVVLQVQDAALELGLDHGGRSDAL